jgi:hypothetical protein
LRIVVSVGKEIKGPIVDRCHWSRLPVKFEPLHVNLVANVILIAILQVVAQKMLDRIGTAIPVHAFGAVGLRPRKECCSLTNF